MKQLRLRYKKQSRKYKTEAQYESITPLVSNTSDDCDLKGGQIQ